MPSSSSRTRRRRAEKLATYLASLPLYDTSDRGRHLIKDHGHNHHVETCIQVYGQSWGRQMLTQYGQCDGKCIHNTRYIPLEEWWHQRARDIRELALSGRTVPPLHALQQTVEKYMTSHDTSLGFKVSKHLLSSYNKIDSEDDAATILYSALVIELARWGIDYQPGAFRLRLLGLIKSCYDLALEHFNHWRYEPRPSFRSNFAQEALSSAFLAGEAFEVFTEEVNAEEDAEYHRHQKEYNEKAHQDFLERKAIAAEASAKIWQRHNAAITIQRLLQHNVLRRHNAATTIARWRRRTVSVQKMKQRLLHRLRVRSLCKNASAHATTIKATQSSRHSQPTSASFAQAPPSKHNCLATSTNSKFGTKVQAHPFRERGLPLPPRKRRQTHRRPRRRPPKQYRSPSTNLQPPVKPPTEPTDIADSFSVVSSSYPSVDALPTDGVPSNRNSNNRPQSIMPLSFWAAQTTAAHRAYNLGSCLPISVSPSIYNDTASKLQHWYRRLIHQHKQVAAASTIQHLYHCQQRQSLTNKSISPAVDIAFENATTILDAELAELDTMFCDLHTTPLAPNMHIQSISSRVDPLEASMAELDAIVQQLNESPTLADTSARVSTVKTNVTTLESSYAEMNAMLAKLNQLSDYG